MNLIIKNRTQCISYHECNQNLSEQSEMIYKLLLRKINPVSLFQANLE